MALKRKAKEVTGDGNGFGPLPAPDGRPQRDKPEPNEYYMRIALSVRDRANCTGNRVGAAVVINNRIVATGYNGVPDEMTNCEENGCYRCSHRDEFQSGQGYDLCICVHAEQNALLSAARHGISVMGGLLYTTLQPCFGCTKEIVQAGIRKVFFLHPWEYPDQRLHHEYRYIQNRIPFKYLKMDDPDEDWALTKKPPEPEESTHPEPS